MPGDLKSWATIDAVVPNYNYGRYVGEAIESLLRQSRPFSKIIVVNDGSTDNSMDVINRYKTLVTVLDTPNSGQLGACLKGLEHVEADYVYFMDADDMARDDLTKELMPLLVTKPAKIQFMLESVDRTGVPNGSTFPSFPSGYKTHEIQKDNSTLGLYICAPTSGSVFNAGLLREMPLNTMRKSDFIDFTPNVMIGYMGDVVSLDRALTQYRVHGANHSECWVDLTPERLERELEWFFNSWAETIAFLPDVNVKPARTAYVLERQIMIRAINNQRVGTLAALEFCARIMHSTLSFKVKAINLAWTAAVLLSRGRTRFRIVQAKRLPEYRPKILNKLFWPQS